MNAACILKQSVEISLKQYKEIEGRPFFTDQRELTLLLLRVLKLICY